MQAERRGGQEHLRGGKPRLLFLAHRLPYPPDSGVSIRAFHLLRLLAQSYEVTLVAFHRIGGTASQVALEQHLAVLRTMVADVVVHPIPQERSRMRWVADHIRSIFTRRPYTEFVYASSAYRAAVVERCRRTEFAVVHMDSMDLVGYLPLLTGLPVVCGHHNIESTLLRRRAGMEANWLTASYLRLQAGWLRQAEVEWCPLVALNVVVSERDRVELGALAPDASIIVVPNGVDDIAMRPQGAGDQGIVFVGGTTWFPNRDALDYFATDVLPRIRARFPEVRTVWVGRVGDEERDRYGRTGITFTGYVDDIREYVGAAACFVVPLRVGGGTRLKILDAWAMGKAIVSTRAGAEGLDAIEGQNIVLREDPQAFAEAVLEVLSDKPMRDRLGRAGRELIEQKYAWDSFREPMIAAYVAAQQARGRSPTLRATSPSTA